MIMSLFVFWMWPTIKDITISLHKCHRKKNVHLNCHCNIYRNVKKRKKMSKLLVQGGGQVLWCVENQCEDALLPPTMTKN